MIAASAITRCFGTVVALDNVDFEAHPGEIHALLGENGAGKTTLMNVIGGRIRPDSGRVMLDGRELATGTRQAQAAGIASVHQSPLLFERLSWEENLAIGSPTSPRIATDQIREEVLSLAESLGFKLPPPGAMVQEQSVSQRVRLEILRALRQNPRVLILDEPTSLFAPGELRPFLETLGKLRAAGRIVILITHKLGEAVAVADRITVLRQGRVVLKTTTARTSEAELASLMIGDLKEADKSAQPSIQIGAKLLEVCDLILAEKGRRVLDGISLNIGAREIAGLAGVDGNGQTQLLEVLAGAATPTSGEIRVGGRPVTPGDPSLAAIPQNRDLDGLILEMELWENLLLAAAFRKRMLTESGWGGIWGKFSGRINRAAAISAAAAIIEKYDVRAPGPRAMLATLSGGNRQRLEVARALESHPQVIVAHNITRGLDPASTAEVHKLLRNFAAAGNAVLLISSDLDELLSLCSSLAVIARGRVREVSVEDHTPERLGLLMSGAAPTI